MKTRSRAAMLAMSSALALGACTKAPATTNTASGSNDRPAQQNLSVDPGSTEAPGPSSPERTAHSSAAQIKVAKAEVKESPDPKSKTITTLSQKNKLGSKTTLLVLDTKDGWVHVALPIRPNGSTGWIQQPNVDVRDNEYSIRVDVGGNRATITKAGQAVLETPVAVGTAQNPTPKGTFYVTDLVQTDDPKGAYGPFALGLSAHSETLTEFGGDGQVALHGTNDPSSIGKAVSHGCVRMPNDAISKLAQMAPLGTPVVIS